MIPTERQIDREIDAEKQPVLILKSAAVWCGVLAIASALVIAAYEFIWESSAQPVSAHVVAFEPMDERSEYAVFEFATDGQVHRGKIYPQKGGGRPNVRIGDAVTVLCQPKRPSSFVRDTIEARFWLPMLFSFAVIPCLITKLVLGVESHRLEELRATRKLALKK